MKKNIPPAHFQHALNKNAVRKYIKRITTMLLASIFMVVSVVFSVSKSSAKFNPNHQTQKNHLATIDPQDTFPVPSGNPKQLFYLQRTSNTNTIVCELNLNEKGIPDPESPVHVFWIRYTEGGIKKELNYIQRVFAYGIKSQIQENGSYKLHFVSYKNRTLLLMNSPKDNKYHVYATINKKEAILSRIFLKVEGGTFWVPNVVYMELKGIDIATGKEVVERFKP